MIQQTDEGAPKRSPRNPNLDVLIPALVAVVFTAIFYLQALVPHHAGFAYKWRLSARVHRPVREDQAGLCLTAFSRASIYRRTTAEFFLRPNFAPYHPFLLLYCLLFRPGTGRARCARHAVS